MIPVHNYHRSVAEAGYKRLWGGGGENKSKSKFAMLRNIISLDTSPFNYCPMDYDAANLIIILPNQEKSILNSSGPFSTGGYLIESKYPNPQCQFFPNYCKHAIGYQRSMLQISPSCVTSLNFNWNFKN